MEEVLMGKILRAGLVVACGALVQGCAAAAGGGHLGSGLGATSNDDQARVSAPTQSVLEFRDRTVDQLWRTLPSAFTDLGIEGGGVVDQASLVYGAYQVGASRVAGKPLEDLFRCGSEGSLTRRRYRIRFDILAQPRATERGGAELTVNIVGVGTVATPDASGTTQCVSNGTIETALNQRLGGAPGVW
jgi:hypothetical protein